MPKHKPHIKSLEGKAKAQRKTRRKHISITHRETKAWKFLGVFEIRDETYPPSSRKKLTAFKAKLKQNDRKRNGGMPLHQLSMH
ncbi:MAG: hypothetical protein Altm1KO_04460 [Alteromonas macleodii]